MSANLSASEPELVASYDASNLVACVRRVAFQIVRSDSDADDLAQETAVMRLTHAPGDGVPETAWLRRVARNFAVTHLRRDTRRRHWESVAEARESVSPEQALAREQAARALVKLIFALPDAQRKVVLLRYFEDLESAQIGERLGLPAGTVRWRLKEALDTLRAELSAKGGRGAWLGALVPLGALESTGMPGSTPAMRAGGLIGKVAVAGAWAALVLAFGICPTRTAKLLPERSAQAEEPAASAPAIAHARPFVFGNVPAADSSPSAAQAADPRAAHRGGTQSPNVDSTSPAPSDKEANDEDLKGQILKLGKIAWQCGVGHVPNDEHSAVYVHVEVVIQGGVGHAVKAAIAPNPFASEGHPLPQSAEMDACVLALVREHEFALPTDGTFDATSIVPILPQLNPAVKPAVPEDQATKSKMREYMHTDPRVLGTKLVQTCAQQVGDLPPTSTGMVRYTRVGDEGPISVAIHVDAGEQNFSGLEDCAMKFLPPEMLDVMLTVGEGKFELPFDPTPSRRAR